MVPTSGWREPLGAVHLRLLVRDAAVPREQPADLFAPYKKDEKHDHGKLCHVLGEHYGIALSLRDFVISIDEGGELHHSTDPLQLVELGDASRLMVVNCSYTLPEERKRGVLAFDIDLVIAQIPAKELRAQIRRRGIVAAPDEDKAMILREYVEHRIEATERVIDR